MISLLILLSIIPATLFIGIIFGLIPYFINPELVFGLRVPDYESLEPEISKMKRENFVYDLAISIFLVILFIVTYTYNQLILIEFILLLEIFLMIAVYFYFRSKTRKLKGKNISSEQQHKISAFIPAKSTNLNSVWYLIPWIELIIFIIVGALYYPSIPSTFATHYGANGKPDAYATKSIFSVFTLLVFIAIPLTVFFDVIIFAIRRVRSNVNVSTSKKASLQLKGFNSKLILFIILVNTIITFTMFLGSLLTWGIIPNAYSFVVVLPPILILPLVLIFSAKIGQGGWKLYPNIKDDKESDTIRNDDNEWAGGLVYHNRKDSSIFVPKRYGVGYTLNFGNKWSFVILGIILAVPIITIIFIVILHS